MAIEVDRPRVLPGNEHSIRVNVSVVRRPHGISVREVLGWRLALPLLLQGHLGTKAQVQGTKARLNRMSVAEIEALFPRMLESPETDLR